MTQLKDSNCDKTPNLNNKNCYKTQNSKLDKAQKIELWQNSNNQEGTNKKLKLRQNSNCDKTHNLSCDRTQIVTKQKKLKLWQN